MGSACSRLQSTQQSNSIDQKLKIDSKLCTHKVLLLGSGESGKSTILKQFRLKNGKLFSDEERSLATHDVFMNMCEAGAALITEAIRLSEDDERFKVDSETQKSFEALSEEQMCNPTLEIVQQMKRIWDLKVIKDVMDKRKIELQILESTKYYFEDRIVDILKPTYLPNDMDILQTRVRTFGVTDVRLQIEETLLNVIDVGGQRSERRKWVQQFEGVNAVLFVVCLSGYARKVYEDESKNQMNDALTVFEEIVQETSFVESTMILFLNKKDLFQEEILVTPLTVCFNDYSGKENDYEEGLEFIKKKFVALNQKHRNKKIYVHVTCAVDRDSMSETLRSIEDMILMTVIESLSRMG